MTNQIQGKLAENSCNQLANKNFLQCEQRWIFALLMCVSGFYGAFTYSIRGGVFCNAQTANFVIFAMALAQSTSCVIMIDEVLYFSRI